VTTVAKVENKKIKKART